MKKFSFVLMLLFLATYSFAKDINLSIEQYYQIDDTLTTTQEISSKEIENKNPIQALDVLENTTGVFLQKTSDTGRTDPIIRGFGDSCRKIVLLLDGKPEKMSLFGCGVSHSLLAGNIDRIEITKGPDSVLYGSGALGGVVNVITKLPTKPFEGKIDLSFGSFNTQNGRIYLGGIQDNIIYEVAADKIVSDGNLHNSQYNATDLYEKLGYIFNDGSILQFQAKQYAGLKHEPIEDQKEENYWEDYHRGSIYLTYIKDFSRSKLDLKLYNNYGDHNFSDGYHSRDSLFGAMANFDFEIGNNNLLKTGAEFRQQNGELLDGSASMTRGNWKTYDYSIFALDKHTFAEKFTAVIGARYSNDEIAGDFVSSRAGLEYTITDSILIKGLYSKGFRNPYLNELYLVPAKNPNLKPEEINSYELGFDIKTDDFVCNINGFIMKGDNLIQKEENKIKPPKYTFRNVGEYEFKGVEFFTGYTFNKYVKASVGYTYFNAGEHTQGRPEHKVDPEIDFMLNKWTLALTGSYVGEYYAADNKEDRLDDFALANIKVSYQVNDNVKLFVDGRNLTNQEYKIFVDRETDGYPVLQMPGASVYFGSEIKF